MSFTPSPTVAYEKSLSVLKSHVLYTDAELIHEMEAAIVRQRQSLAESERQAKKWLQGSQSKSQHRFEAQQKGLRLRMYQDGLEGLRRQDYRVPGFHAFVDDHLGKSYANPNYSQNDFELAPTPDWRLKELQERTALDPELTQVWLNWLESGKPLRKIDLKLLDRATWDCAQAQQAKAQMSNQQDDLKAAAARLRAPQP